MSMLLKKQSLLKMAQRKFSAAAGAAPHDGGMKLWKNLSLYMSIPCVVVMSVYNFMNMASHEIERPEFVPYEHLRIRNKRFPWGDGQRSFFHNPHVNPLPSGYEDDGHGHH